MFKIVCMYLTSTFLVPFLFDVFKKFKSVAKTMNIDNCIQ